MTDTLRTRIAAVLYHRWWESSMSLNEPPRWNQLSQSARDKWLQDADAVIRELGPIPDRTHVDDQGRIWEWCGGQPGTWAWRITQNAPVEGRMTRRRPGGTATASTRKDYRPVSTDDLRTRIAKHLHDRYADSLVMGSERAWDDEHPMVRDDWLRDADTLIRELQLTVLGDGIVVGVIHE